MVDFSFVQREQNKKTNKRTKRHDFSTCKCRSSVTLFYHIYDETNHLRCVSVQSVMCLYHNIHNFGILYTWTKEKWLQNTPSNSTHATHLYFIEHLNCKRKTTPQTTALELKHSHDFKKKHQAFSFHRRNFWLVQKVTTWKCRYFHTDCEQPINSFS